MDPKSSPNPAAPDEEKPVPPVADDVLAELSTVKDEPAVPEPDTKDGSTDEPVPDLESAEQAVADAAPLPADSPQSTAPEDVEEFDTSVSDSSGVLPDLSPETDGPAEDHAKTDIPVVVNGSESGRSAAEVPRGQAGEAPAVAPSDKPLAGVTEVFTGSDIPAPETAPELEAETRTEDSVPAPETAAAPLIETPGVPAVQPAAEAAAKSPVPQGEPSANAAALASGTVVAPSVRSDKKTVLILTAMAIVLLIAIVVLYFV